MRIFPAEPKIAMVALFSLVGLYMITHMWAGVNGITPVPHEIQGVSLNGHSLYVGDLRSEFEVFLDPLCPDSKETWPVIKELAFSGDADLTDVLVRFSPFPLPYHHHSFLVSQPVAYFNRYGGSEYAVEYMDLIFKNLDQFGNNVPVNAVKDKINKMISENHMLSKAGGEQFEKGGVLNSGSIWDLNLRTQWKYGCSKGVSGTPFYFVNGVLQGDAEAYWTFQQWKEILKPIESIPAKAERALPDM